MPLALIADRAASAIFMLAAAVLLAWRTTARRARVAWTMLIALGLSYDVALNLQPVNFPHSNFDHYYLGAKYPGPYFDLYRLILAGQGRPQIGMRDLGHPADLVRATTYGQRAYYIDLLRGAHAVFDPLAPLDSLAARALDSGAVEAESQRILSSRLPAGRIGDYRRDARDMLAIGQGPRVTLDYGYNGSPFYGLVRQVDPTLHLPFGRLPAAAALAWQLLGIALIAWLAGPALGLTAAERLAVAALLLISAEFANFAMPGLVFTELWVPVLLAMWALRRGRRALTGAAIAFAGLIKLFPFALLLAAGVPLAWAWTTGAKEPQASGARRRAIVMLATCAAATLVLGALALASGRTWADFLHKIVVEFQSRSNMINSVSLAAALATLGVPDRSPLYIAYTLSALVPLIAMFWRREDADSADNSNSLTRRCLVLIAAMGWLTKSWLNYYAVAPFVLLPFVARRHRIAAGAIVAGMAGSYLLPAFDDPLLLQSPALHLLKLVPYVATPAWLVWLELRDTQWPRRWVRGAGIVALLLVVATGEEIWRGHEIQRWATSGEEALRRSDAAAALMSFDRLLKLSPRDGGAEHKRAIALAMSGRMDEALPAFARSTAIEPRDAAAHDDYGRALLMRGRLGEAADQLEIARSLTPADVQVLFVLARAREAQGRRAEAIALLARARELAPEEPAFRGALERMQQDDVAKPDSSSR